MDDDLFDDVLHVESRFHQEGYQEGLRDGAKHGLAEGRAFGLQKGFEKWLESGKLAGKSIVWANRLPSATQSSAAESSGPKLPSLPNNARLDKNVHTLYSLVDPKTLSIDNSDAAVQDFDERLKKAQGKERIVSRVVHGPTKDGQRAGSVT